MFELLLQADKSLAGGALDQAEKTYWQLIELDPTNAIAFAGLARVSLERGNESGAREYADKSLAIDPDSIAAKKILETLTKKGPKRATREPTETTLKAAERLEALSRRHRTDTRNTDETALPDDDVPRKAVARVKTAGAPAAAKAAVVAAPRPAAKPAKESRGRTRPDQIEPMPSEPLHERRKAGRLAAAAAAAAAAAREPVRARHDTHHAMPIGRRFFQPGELNVPAADEFSAAEMAAAVEAVGVADDIEASEPAATAPAGRRRSGDLSDLLGDFDATAADESVALRIALVADAAELDAAEREAAQNADEESSDSFEAAEAMASSALFAAHAAPAESLFTRSAEPATDEFDAAEAEAAGFLEVELPVLGADFADADAAEAAAVAEAVREVAATDDLTESEPGPVRRSFERAGAQEPSEEEAEAQALREALAAVLEGDSPIGDGVPAARPHRASDAKTNEAEAPAAAEVDSTEPATGPGDGSDTGPHKGGLFHRIRGN